MIISHGVLISGEGAQKFDVDSDSGLKYTLLHVFQDTERFSALSRWPFRVPSQYFHILAPSFSPVLFTVAVDSTLAPWPRSGAARMHVPQVGHYTSWGEGSR